MRKTKKNLLLIVLFLMGIGLFTACQNSAGNNKSNTTNQADTNLPDGDGTSEATPTSSTEDKEMGDSGDLTATPTSAQEAMVTETPDLTPIVVAYEESKVPGSLMSISSRVSVHDPSIIYNASNGEYYVFGSHKAWAESTDLADWNTFTTNVSFDFAEIFSENGEWSARGSSTYSISGNLWAPDVIYNEDMGKWCMYMSVNGSNYYSSIALATADDIDGPYTYAGTVCYSGFTNAEEASYTDYEKVTGTSEVDDRYLTIAGKWNSAYGVNCIDPCVFYDEYGQLWMSYGSWFGGIYLLKLDETTGLRDYGRTYETVKNSSDEYLGVKLSGGYGCTGEGSYVVWDQQTGYYYLYLSYCGLDATDNFSGYHIRLFRSENVEGPYLDAAGNGAICTKSGESQSNKGIKLFGNYYFSSLESAPGSSNAYKGYMSGGHNSALIDTDGAHYLIYHTRFNLGSEWHQIRVHQQFMNEDGWPVTAVYEYLGSAISETGYSAEEITGSYELVNHGLAATTQYTGMLDTLTVSLGEDGTISGDVTGTWEEHTGTDGNGYYATFVIEDVTYKGVFFKQYDESKSHNDVMTFSLIGTNNRSVWGSKLDAGAELEEELSDIFPDVITEDTILVTSLSDGSIQYSSANESLLSISEDGTTAIYHKPEYDSTVELTATYQNGDVTIQISGTVTVKGDYVSAYQKLDNLIAYYSFNNTKNAGADQSAGGKKNASVYGAVITSDSERGAVITFDGENDYLKLPSEVTSDSSDFTFMAWVKADSAATWSRIFDFGDNKDNSLFTTVSSGTGLRTAMKANAASEDQITDSQALEEGEWHHIAVTLNGTTLETSLYLDGELVGSAIVDAPLTSFTGSANYIGKSQYSDPYFDGSMDDIAVFGQVLTVKEIKEYLQY